MYMISWKIEYLKFIKVWKILQFFDEMIENDMMSSDIFKNNKDIIKDVEQTHI